MPCFYSKASKDINDVENLFKTENGKLLAYCTPGKAENVVVFTNGKLMADVNSIKKAVSKTVYGDKNNGDRIFVYRKCSNFDKEEALVLLRNPYGEGYVSDGKEYTFERRLFEMMDSAVNYIRSEGKISQLSQNKNINDEVATSFTNFADLLEKAKERVTKKDKEDKTIFTQELEFLHKKESK